MTVPFVLMLFFRTGHPVIGMVHLPPLPGSPENTLDPPDIRDFALRDAWALAEGGIDALILENIGDAPFYPGRVPPHTVSFLTALAHDLRKAIPLPLGINVLRNDGMSALAIAAAVDALFIRVNVFTGARVTDQGIIQAQPHKLARYRRLLRSRVAIFADIDVKHSAALAPRPLADEVADTIQRAKADAIIVSGAATGKPLDETAAETARLAAGDTPVFAGSGVSVENAARMLFSCNGIIVGTSVKRDGLLHNPVDPERVRALMAVVRPVQRM